MSDVALDADIDRAAQAVTLLVAMDFDGTLSELVDVASDARPVDGAIDALTRLAGLARTAVVLVSGRAVADLGRISQAPDVIELVGSHGAEHGRHASSTPTGALLESLNSATAALNARCALTDGAWLERKPAAVVMHYRQVDDADRAALLADTAHIAAEHPDLVVADGKCVVELSAHAANKGQAVRLLRNDLSADVVVFAGDDATDEYVFAELGPTDVGIKVGRGPTRASRRVDHPTDVVDVLGRLAQRRAAAG